ncbi:MAG: class I SAM-dependent methyltransferase [Myxococcota bacterium]
MALPGTLTPEMTARQAEMLGNRVKKRFRKQKKPFERRGIEAFRLYDRDIPEIRAVVDWYGGHVVIAEYARTQTDAVADWLAQMADGVRKALDLPEERVHLKTRRTRPAEGPRYRRLSKTKRRVAVREGALSFWVNLNDYIDTGLFLDHRQTRAWVGSQASGGHVLNLYGYTGSFTCYAAAGGARSTTTVDRSATYLEWMKDNLRLNGLKGRDHRAVQDTAETFLIDARRGGHVP